MVSMSQTDLTWMTGGCHCGAVRFRVGVRRLEALQCNCSICSMKGYLHVIVPPEHFEALAGAQDMSVYRFNTGTAEHSFCPTCGVAPYYRPRSHPGRIDVNARCLDEDGESRFTVRPFDGRRWESNVASIQDRES